MRYVSFCRLEEVRGKLRNNNDNDHNTYSIHNFLSLVNETTEEHDSTWDKFYILYLMTPIVIIFFINQGTSVLFCSCVS